MVRLFSLLDELLPRTDKKAPFALSFSHKESKEDELFPLLKEKMSPSTATLTLPATVSRKSPGAVRALPIVSCRAQR